MVDEEDEDSEEFGGDDELESDDEEIAGIKPKKGAKKGKKSSTRDK